MLHRSSLLFASAVTLGGAAAAQGTLPSIYVDFSSSTATNGGPITSSTFAGAASTPGMWNDVDLDLVVGPILTTAPLIDIGGTTTGVTFEIDGLGTNFLSVDFDEPFTTGDDGLLMDDCAYNGGPSTMTFNGLPPGTYDVITYAMAPDSDAYFTNVSVQGSPDLPQDVGGNFATGYVKGVTHARHTVTISAGQPLVIDVNVATTYDSVNGVQVFPSVPSTIGTSYCGPAVTNSSGAPAELVLTGSASAAANDLTATCSSMPANAFGFFLVSTQQGFVMNPGGSEGNLCVGGAIGRYVGPGQILNAGAAGEISLQLDLTMIPSPTGFVVGQAGDTFNWTTWFRDNVGGVSTSNFSQGVSVVLL